MSRPFQNSAVTPGLTHERVAQMRDEAQRDYVPNPDGHIYQSSRQEAGVPGAGRGLSGRY